MVMQIWLFIGQKDPYYNGNYIQILTNDGQGNYTDTTNEIPSDFLKDAYKTGWVEYWHLLISITIIIWILLVQHQKMIE